MDEKKIREVVQEMETIIFCYGKLERFPRSFYKELNDQERAEVCKRIRRSNMGGA